MRPDLAEVLRELVDRLGVRDRRRAREEEVVDHPLEHVRERQERQRDRVASSRRRASSTSRRSTRSSRASGSRPSARPSCRTCRSSSRGRAGRTDDARSSQASGPRARAARPFWTTVSNGVACPALHGTWSRTIDVLELRAAVADVEDLLELDRARDDDDLRERVPQDVLDLRREVASCRSARSARRARASRSPSSATRAGSPRGSRRGPPGRRRGARARARGPACARRTSAAESGVQAPSDLRDEEVRLPARGGEAEVVEESFRGKRFDHVRVRPIMPERSPLGGAREGRQRPHETRARPRSPRGSRRGPPGLRRLVRPGCGRTRPRRPRRRRSPSARR